MESRDESLTASDEQYAPILIVCLYSERDEPMYRDLQTHLVLWHARGNIRWLELSAGADIEQTLLTFVRQADLILLLISSSFFATSLYHRVMERALAEQAKRGVPVVPILARACDWKESACGNLKAFPDNERPIAEWQHQERAYENIRAGLVRLIPGLTGHMAYLAIRPKHFQARDLPKGYVPRPKAFNEIKRLLLNRQDGQMTAITTALRGAGGFGKTTLALALCHDPEIQTAFPDGILWVELGEQPPRPLDVLNGVLHSLDDSLSGAITLEEAQDRWHKTLLGRICLLVIDDVWQAAALEPLLEGGPQCVRLVTTRNDHVLPEETARVWVDAMEQEEAIAVLCRRLPEEIQQVAYQPTLEDLARRLGYWPLLLTLAHGLLVAQIRRKRTLIQALALIEQAYETRGVLAFDPGDVTDRKLAIKACIEVSLHHLEEWISPRYTEAEMGGLLLSHLGWEEVFAAQRLFLERELPRPFITVWFPLPSGVSSALLRTLHGHTHGVNGCTVNPDGGFIVSASQDHTLKVWSTFMRFEWFFLKGHTHVVRGCAVSPDGRFIVSASGDRTLKVWDVTTKVERFTLTGHIGSVSGCAVSPDGRFIISASDDKTLKMWDASTGTECLTFTGHTDSVNSCTVSPDGRFIISVSDDKTLKLWDAYTGQCLLTFPVDGSLYSCAFHRDGEHLVACGEQGIYFLRLVV